ncbi:MAG: hypothetical protein FJ308_00475 [Planctomycetes bacterium]|nr:hypothetical protein [Planctomycetota bacterium]
MAPLELQRLIDGEMTHAQRADLLHRLGNDTEQWKTLAMSLLEEQQWSREVAQVVRPESVPAPMQPYSESPTVMLAHPTPSLVRDEGTNNHGSGTSSGMSAGTRRSWNWVSALAAGALFTVGLAGGSWMRSLQSAGEGQGGAMTQVPVVDGNSQVAVNAPKGLSDYKSSWEAAAPLRMVVSGLDSKKSEIPLVNAKDIDPNLLMASEALEMAKLNKQLRRQGYEMDVRPQYYSGNLGDGRKVVVPIHNVSLKPYGL